MGGLIGDDKQWAGFCSEWSAKLKKPVPDRAPLQKFHMAECEAGAGSFAGWSRAERDLVVHDFRQIILEAQVHGFVCGVSRPDWDELVIGKNKIALGDAERFCVMHCMRQTVEIALSGSAEKHFSLVFDKRGDRDSIHRRVYEVFELAFLFAPDMGTAHGIAFQASDEALPLQAADLIAWEFYQLFSAYAHKGNKVPARPHMMRLIESNRFLCMFLQRRDIERIVEKPIHPDAWHLFSRQFT